MKQKKKKRSRPRKWTYTLNYRQCTTYTQTHTDNVYQLMDCEYKEEARKHGNVAGKR